MFGRLFGYIITIMFCFCLIPKANAETLILLSGQKIVGKIIEQTELRVMVDVKGVPQTFFLAEIASIDGKKAEMPQEKAVDAALEETVKPVSPPSDEQNSLESFMSKRNSTAVSNSPDQKSSVTQTPKEENVSNPKDADKMDTLLHGIHEMMGKMDNANKNVVPTPDGGIIVVGPQKIVKYDKNLKEIKEISLNPDSPALSK